MPNIKKSGNRLSEEHMILSTREYLINRIIYNPNNEIRNLDEQYSHIFQLWKRTIETGEGNSALLIGPRGSGKTMLVNKVLNDLMDLEGMKDNVIIVKLHGLVHTNDRLAIIDITRQMQLDNVVGDKVFGSFAENLSFLLECIKSGSKKVSKPIIFIVDEFDLFCAHLNQTLLYNLFDVSQTAKVPVCVLGLTCRLDVVELFEKRVKSRFSHRRIFMQSENSETSFNDRLNLFKSLLSLLDDEANEFTNEQFRLTWNKNIKSIAVENAVKKILKCMYENNNNERNFRNYLTLVISLLSLKHKQLEVNDFVTTSTNFLQDDKIILLQGLSVLEMCLIIAMKHDTEIHDGEPFNFKSILTRYLKFSYGKSEMQSIKNTVILKAFEHLKRLELLLPIGGVITKTNREYQMYKLAVTSDQVMEAIKTYKGMPTEVAHWASNNLQI